MDISKKLYLFAFLFLLIIGVVALSQKPLKSPAAKDKTEENKHLNEALKNVLNGYGSAVSDDFEGQIPESFTDKYRTVKAEEEKTFERKRQTIANAVPLIDGGGEDQFIINERNARIKNVEDTLSKMANSLPPLPEGFFYDMASPYVFYREAYRMTEDLKKLMLKMHKEILQDTAPFSVLTEIERIFVMLFTSRENYTRYSKRPEWSGAMTDIYDQSIYIVENKSFKSTFMHELTHIYFDGFFEPARAPRWLSEGFAVYVQTLYQTPQENRWLEQYGQKFAQEEYIKFDEFVSVPDLSTYHKEDVKMWYAQSYSVVKFLFEHYGSDDFYRFSKNLKDGMPLGKALYRSFGMPLNSSSALESAWQADLKKNLQGRYM